MTYKFIIQGRKLFAIKMLSNGMFLDEFLEERMKVFLLRYEYIVRIVLDVVVPELLLSVRRSPSSHPTAQVVVFLAISCLVPLKCTYSFYIFIFDILRSN